MPKLNGDLYQWRLITIPTNSVYVRLAAICGPNDNTYEPSIKIKFEFGSKPTGYNLAPEDVIDDIQTAKNEAITSANNNTTTVIQNYYTKSQTDSQINIAKEAINLGVSTNYETKANVESKVSSTLDSAKSYADTKKTEAINSAASDASTKVNNAKTELNDAIGTKANSADVYKKSEVYTRAQTDSQINVAKEAINLGVSQAYETKTNVESKINSITVGGVNKLIGTATSKTISAYITGTNFVTNDPYKTYNNTSLRDLGFKVGDKVTIGFNWSISKNGSNDYRYGNFRVELVGNNSSGAFEYLGAFQPVPMVTFSASNTSGRVESTLTMTDSLLGAYGLRIRIDDSVLNLTISRVKLEKGEKATDWDIAPEDIDGNISTAKTEAINSANNTLTTTIANYYTKAQTDSAITVAKNEINLGVSQTYETKSNVQTKINSITVGGKNLVKQSKSLSNAQGVSTDESSGIWVVNNTGNLDEYNQGIKRLYIETTRTDWVECQIPLYSIINTITSPITISFDYYESVQGLLSFSIGSYNNVTRLSEISNIAVKDCTVISENGAWKRVSYTINDPAPINGKSGANQYKLQFKKVSGKTGLGQVKFPKVEIGNKATDWGPAPEDIEANANNYTSNQLTSYYTKEQTDSQINVAKEAINLGVSNTYETKTNVSNKFANYYTKTQTDSQINVAKEAINLGVSNTYETKTNVSNKFANYYTKTQTDSQINVAKEAINLEVAKKVNSDSIISSINLSPESIRISSNKISIDGAVVINSINSTTSTSINGNKIRTGVISATNNRIKFDLDNGYILAYDESGSLVGRTVSNKMNNTTIYGMSSAAEAGHYVAMSYKINESDSAYTFGVVCTGTDGLGGGSLKKGVNIQAPLHINDMARVNGYLRWDGFTRSSGDKVEIYKTTASTESNIYLRLADDVNTNFRVTCNHYTKGHMAIAKFHYPNSSDGSVAGIDFYTSLNMHKWYIQNAKGVSAASLSADSLSLTSDTATVKSSSPVALMALDNDFNDIQQATKTQYIATSTQKQIMHTGTIEIGLDKIEYVELPEDFLMCVDIQIVASPNKLCKFAITSKDEYGFIIETDTENVTFDYVVTGTKMDGAILDLPEEEQHEYCINENDEIVPYAVEQKL